jgi:hypothetical protein
MLERKNITPDSIEEVEQKESFKDLQPKFDAKNYLDVKLKDGVKKELRIRLLPFDSETASPFKVIHMHNTKVDKEIAKSGYKNYICLRTTDDIDHDKYGTKCPFCELRKQAYEKLENYDKVGDKDSAERKIWEEIYKQNKVKDVCIVRCIERGAEEDGPKFWKFNLRNDKMDPKNEIINIYNNRKMESIEEEYGPKIQGMSSKEINEMCKNDGFNWFNVLDVYEGKDLKLVIEPVYENGKLTNKTNIKINDYGKTQPLSTDETLIDKWINDSKKWTDVFGVKDYNYLSLIIEGKVPFYDKNQNKWVAKEDVTWNKKEDVTEEQKKLDNKIQETKEQTKQSTLSVNDELPF